MPSAEADPVPELCHVDVRQQSSGVIQYSLMRHADGASQHLVGQAQRPERANAVAGQVEAGAACRPGRRTLDEFRNEGLLAQRPAESETGDSATNYQDA